MASTVLFGYYCMEYFFLILSPSVNFPCLFRLSKFYYTKSYYLIVMIMQKFLLAFQEVISSAENTTHCRCARSECLVLTLIVLGFHIYHICGCFPNTQVYLYIRQRGCEVAFSQLFFFSLLLTIAFFNRDRSDFISLYVRCIFNIFLHPTKGTKVVYPLNLYISLRVFV